ncbi:Uncharacterized protein BP5553_03593 [Venustampulla echinocandica]|uniref:Peptidyl-tRNA hydrolase n=1 Tax=Venustampulla echinocandica TaxID=2656787 RepID=A0A370TUP4_9HELO|nr:Uncharacterized protein BP5553_03593 [Venustampulla echinocandica]RDL39253.1 Uncharacterized protein BP5553_03593 [Venustampulla echinocandica]
MRLSTASILALPLLAAAAQQETPLDQAKAQAQYWFDKISSYIPNPNKAHAPDLGATKAPGKPLHVLTLDSWVQTIRGSVNPASTTPEEWWIMVTGGNKTCFGHCLAAETAWNQTAALWSTDPTSPNTGYLNCDDQPVLCNSWGAGPPALWIMEVSAPPANVDIRVKGLNATETTVKTFTDLRSSKEWKTKPKYISAFHPFDGPLAVYGLAVPLGYVLWVFATVPSWAFMIGISFISRTIMSKRTLPPQRPAGAAPGGAAAPPARVGAPRGDGISY